MSAGWLFALLTGSAPQEALSALPAESPIGGIAWSLVVPAVLLGVAFGGTLLLYRRFAGEEEHRGRK